MEMDPTLLSKEVFFLSSCALVLYKLLSCIFFPGKVIVKAK